MSDAENARARMQTVVGEVRAYFAPVERNSGMATVFDPNDAGFDLDAPPVPWVDLGWVRNFERRATTKLQSIRTGTAGVARLQYRQMSEAAVSFEFCEWGKLQMMLAAGSQHVNVLAREEGSSGAAKPAHGLATGSTAQELMLSADALAEFEVGDLVAVDVDYSTQTGYVGTGVAGAYVKGVAPERLDGDYVRRVTLNVGKVQEKTANSLKLAQPLLGGAPGDTAAVQKVVAFVDREGASFLQEWSALFVMEPRSGGRLSYYYPRLQTAEAAAESMSAIGDMKQVALRAVFVALPIEDPMDGEQVVCYRTFVPDCGAAVY
jgi:hypothetical protein